jgi:dTDP-glucose 4,6-dehydratase
MLTSHSEISITNLDRLSYGSNPSNLADIPAGRAYRFVKGDINDLEIVKKLLCDIDAVINIAAETHVDRSISNPRLFHQTNTAGVLNLLEACRARDVTFMQVSTDEVYGSASGELAFAEDMRLDPSSPYAASKAAADMLVNAYHKTYGLPTFITRSTNNFGPYQFPEKFIPKTIIRASLNLSVPIYGSGHQVRDWIYVKDHCEALDLVLRMGSPGEIYNIAGGNQFENLQVVEAVLKFMGKPRSLIEHVEDRPGHDFRYSLDASKIARELGWRPRHSFLDALKKTVEWYLQNESWWRPLIDEKVLSPAPWKERW